MGIIQDHILGRAEGSTPESDLTQLGFDPDGLYQEVLHDENMTTNMVAAMSVADQIPQVVFAKYAMTWFAIGAAMQKEKTDRDRSDNLP